MHGDACHYQRNLPDVGARPQGITPPDGSFGEDTVHFRAIWMNRFLFFITPLHLAAIHHRQNLSSQRNDLPTLSSEQDILLENPITNHTCWADVWVCEAKQNKTKIPEAYREKCGVSAEKQWHRISVLLFEKQWILLRDIFLTDPPWKGKKAICDSYIMVIEDNTFYANWLFLYIWKRTFL